LSAHAAENEQTTKRCLRQCIFPTGVECVPGRRSEGNLTQRSVQSRLP
jgi:hypothetical protein